MTDTAGFPDDETSSSTPEPPSRVYHYTTAAGLLGIVNGARGDAGRLEGSQPLTFWASDLLDMNDASELAFGLELIRERAELAEREHAEQGDTASRPNSPRIKPDELVSFLEQYLGVPSLDADRTMEPRPSVCGTSFSAGTDLLNQWVRYGSGGGFAIGIEIEHLRDVPCRAFNSRSGEPEDFPCSFAEIKYGEDARRYIDKFLSFAPDALEALAAALGVAGDLLTVPWAGFMRLDRAVVGTGRRG